MNHADHEESLPLRGLHALAPWSWRMLVVAVVLLAAYVALGRFFMSQVPALREPILAELNQRLPFELQISSLSGGWSAFSPELTFADLVLLPREAGAEPVALGSGSLRMDLPASLSTRSLQLSRLELSDLAMDARLTDTGAIEIAGFGGGGDSEALQLWLQAFLPNVRRLALTDNRVSLGTVGGSFDLRLDLHLERDGNTRTLQGRVQGDSIDLAINAEGVGNPLNPQSWAGNVFLDAKSSDLARLTGLWETLDWPFRLSGSADAQFWLSRLDGDSIAHLRWSSAGLEVEERGGAWSLPLDALTFEAALDQRARHWSFLTEDLHVEHAGQALDLDRAQFDWWGQALRVRAKELSLDALPTIFAAGPGLPEGLRKALPDLAPSGYLQAIELRLDDLSAPATSWHLRAALEDLSVGSWRNTPALTGVTGYLDLQPQGGQIQVDAREFSMHYPNVFNAPLAYEDVLGDLYFTWDRQGLRIDSGLVRVNDPEGQASALFAVDIPFVPRDTGIELDLLIGLTGAGVEHRGKYLPYKLPQPLLSWLDTSLQGGEVRQGGFIWRGSTRKGMRDYKTFQLFLQGQDTRLRYDPAWPVLTGLDAMVWVDDGRTYGRAAKAQSGGVELSDVMVRVLPRSGGADLSIAGDLAGDAANAGVLLRDSPLRDITAGVFERWEFSGPTKGRLRLDLPLDGSGAAPVVDLSVAVTDADIRIDQVDLFVHGVNGQLSYASDRGFTGSRAAGESLGGHFSAVAGPADRDSLDLQIQAEIDAGAVADWLALPLLNFASGQTGVQGNLKIAPEEDPVLTLRSELVGVDLEVPEPFGKVADEPLELAISVPLRGDTDMQLGLGERLRFEMALRGGEFSRLVGAVGGTEPDVVACDQRYCLSGAVSSLDIAAWSDFYDRFIVAEGDADESNPVPFSYRIDSLSVGELRISQRLLGTARVDLWGVDALWQGNLESDWVQGSLSHRDDQSHLLIEYLDAQRFGDGDPMALADVRDVLSDMRVDVLEYRHGERYLGSFGFNLDATYDPDALFLTGVEGDLWGMTLDGPGPGLVRWSMQDGQEYTELELDVEFDDLGDVLESAGFAPTLESEEGAAQLRLRWPGAPTALAAVDAEGLIALNAINGRVLESRPGALAMISVLNLAEILRGLSLNHMFESGIPFQRAHSEFHLHQGMLEVTDLQIDGAASAFAFTGLSDLQERSIDGELVVTLPVANNLPWVAALAAGLPVAAGVFVVSKVFEKQVNRMSSAVYGVSGAIEAPEVEFRRLFDDQLTPTAAGLEDSGTGDD